LQWQGKRAICALKINHPVGILWAFDLRFFYSLFFGQFLRSLAYKSPCILCRYLREVHFYFRVEPCHLDAGAKSVVPMAAAKTVFYYGWRGFDRKRKPMKMCDVRLVKSRIACRDPTPGTDDLTHTWSALLYSIHSILILYYPMDSYNVNAQYNIIV